MAKGDYLTPHQKGIVKRYYDNRDDIMMQKLTEAVSDLYVCETEKEANRLWGKVETALGHVCDKNQRVKTICEERDLQALADLVNELF